MLAIRLGRVLAPLAALLAGCAHTVTAAHAEDEARIAALETELAALRRDLAPASTLAQPVVVSSATSQVPAGSLALESGAELVLPSEGSVVESDPDAIEPTRDGEGGRVVLRLHEEPRAPIPVVSERLPVATMPTMPVATAPATPTAATRPPSGAATTSSPVAAVPAPGTTTAYVPTATTVPVATSAASGQEDLRGYRDALDHLTARRFEQAVSGFSGFLRDQPGSARADDALYFRATAQYALRRYQEALVDYERVVRIAPRGDRAADALYHAALCLRRLGDTPRATTTMRRVIDEYPDTGAARLAQREDRT